ncbi:hypothetical protein H0H87_012003 [Tephrocybe sp. NHM501043]|nr:hypothetical protein H0H87_012003 [Tephrocybe sp. NHM501043]
MESWNHITSLHPPLVSTPINHPELLLPTLPTFPALARTLIGRWKAYLKWEESDPLKLEEKDKSVFLGHIQNVYRKAVIHMHYYTEIWFMAYAWTNGVGNHKEMLNILKAGMEANPASFLLMFAYAKALEAKKEFTEVHLQFDRLLSILGMKLDEFETQLAAEKAQKEAQNVNNPDIQAVIKPGTAAAATKQPEKDRWTPWEMWEAAALVEYHCSEDKAVTSRIFEKGMVFFADKIEFVLCYMDFLISVNNETST